MAAFFFGVLLGMFLILGLIATGIWLLLLRGSTGAAAVLQAVALALKPNQADGHEG